MDESGVPPAPHSPLIVRAALYALIWWDAVGVADDGGPDTCHTLEVLEERSEFWMDWLLAAADTLRDDPSTGLKVHSEQSIRQRLGIATAHRNRSKANGVTWPWIQTAQRRGAPPDLLTDAAKNRLATYLGKVTAPWGRMREFEPATRQAVELGINSLGSTEAAKRAWADLAKVHRPLIARIHALLPADRLPPTPARPDTAPILAATQTHDLRDHVHMHDLPGYQQLRQLCLEPDAKLYASDSFALLVGVWEQAEAAFSGIFPAIHQKNAFAETLGSHLRHLARTNGNVNPLGGKNPHVPRHVAELAKLVGASGAPLVDRRPWDTAFSALRATWGDPWAQRDPAMARGKPVTREDVRGLAAQALAPGQWANQHRPSVSLLRNWHAQAR
jgi:hypothetical protein